MFILYLNFQMLVSITLEFIHLPEQNLFQFVWMIFFIHEKLETWSKHSFIFNIFPILFIKYEKKKPKKLIVNQYPCKSIK